MRTFTIQRGAETEGEGVVFTDGSTLVRWTPAGQLPTTTIYESVGVLLAFHAAGLTVHWIAPAADEGVSLIAAERIRQLVEEGWTLEHDDEHTAGELAAAAACYAMSSTGACWGGRPPLTWPWDSSWWKPANDPIRDLIRAGALIAAEIDRLLRAGAA